MPEPDTDVVVVGAGPTGLVLAALLADFGVRVTVLERRPSTGDEPRAISICDESMRILQQLGLLDALAPGMLLDTGARFLGRNGRVLAEIGSGEPRLGQPTRSQFDQPELEARLAETVAARPNATLRFGAEVTGLSQRGGAATVVFRGASGEASVTADWVIGCDGGHSFIRSAAGIPFPGATQVEKWLVVDLRGAELTPAPFIDFHCDGVRPHVVVPGAEGRRRYEFMMLPGDDEATIASPASIARLIEGLGGFGGLGGLESGEIRRAAVYVAHRRIARHYRAGRVLLAGDAAHLMPPFAGQGLNAGLRDAANLAWKVASVVDGTGTDALIDTYETERRPNAYAMMRLSHVVGGFVMSRNPAANALRDLAADIVDLVPPWQRRLTAAEFPAPPHFAAGCLVHPTSGMPPAVRALVGRSLPQPLVRPVSGPATTAGSASPRAVPLDDVLGRRWSLLSPTASGELAVTTLPGPLTSGAVPVTSYAQDPTGRFAPAAGFRLLVRPDRYVAAVVPSASATPPAHAAGEALSAYSAVPAELLGMRARR